MKQRLFGIGTLVGTLLCVGSASAQPHRYNKHEVTVVARHGQSSHHASKRKKRGHKSYRSHTSKRERRLRDERRDLQQIVDISRAWRRSTMRRDRYEQSLADRRLELWIDRELREADYDRHGRYDARRLRRLRHELYTLNVPSRYRYSRRHYYIKKARILDELIHFSERQVHQAQTYAQYPARGPYAAR